MKPEILHTLLLDRAVGELSAETSELLEAYLATAPADAAAAERLASTIAAARAAVAVNATAAAAPTVIRAWRPSFTRRFIAFRELWRLAACLVLGGLVGWGAAHSAGSRDAAAEPIAPIATHAPARPTTAPMHTSGAFWRPTSLARSVTRPLSDAPRYRLRWDPSRPAPTLEETP